MVHVTGDGGLVPPAWRESPDRSAEALLGKWFHTTWLMARSKRGVPAMEPAAQVGVPENAARRMRERVRGAMARSECPRRALG